MSDQSLGIRLDMLPGCIRFWERILFHDRVLLSPDMQVIIESTVKYLKAYQFTVQSKQGELSIEKSSENSSP